MRSFQFIAEAKVSVTKALVYRVSHPTVSQYNKRNNEKKFSETRFKYYFLSTWSFRPFPATVTLNNVLEGDIKSLLVQGKKKINFKLVNCDDRDATFNYMSGNETRTHQN